MELKSPMLAGQIVAAVLIVANLGAALYTIKRAKAARPPKRTGHTIVIFFIVSMMMLPSLLGSQRLAIVLPVYGAAFIVALVNVRRLISPRD